MYWRESRGTETVHILFHSYISLTDEVKINEQNKSIGSTYKPKLKQLINLISTAEIYSGFNSYGVSGIVIRAWSNSCKFKTPKCILP